jgi:hypothetical protein
MSDNPEGLGYSNYMQAQQLQQPETSMSQWLPGSQTLQRPPVPPSESLTARSNDVELASSTASATTTMTMEAQAARARAMEIIRRFQGANQLHNNASVQRNAQANMLQQHMEYSQNSAPYSMYDSPNVYAVKRQECLEKLRHREHAALLKNLEYLSHMEDARLERRLEQIQQAREYEQHVNNQFQQRGNAQSCAGIGTDQWYHLTKRAEKHISSTTDSVAIYVDNLPRDGSAGEDLLRNLFSLYGTIRKVHFYLDKQTQELKGDALVIFHNVQDKNLLIEAVCSQLNGCELPGGHALLVQPSDPLHKLRKKKMTANEANLSHCGPNTSSVALSTAMKDGQSREQESLNIVGSVTEREGDGNGTIMKTDDQNISTGDDDLDDFFASL